MRAERSNPPFIMKDYYVYILSNEWNTVLYTGITNDIKKRIYQQKLVDGFSKKYNLNKLVYYEIFNNVEAAILREKQIKAGSRKKKIELVEKMNGSWTDLYCKL